MTPQEIATLARNTAALERVATLSLSARPDTSGSVDVTVTPRCLRGAPVHGAVPVDLYASGAGAAALPGAAPAVLPYAGTPARRVRGIARRGRMTIRLEPSAEEEVTLTAVVPSPHYRPFLRWPATSLRLPFNGNVTGSRLPTRSTDPNMTWTVVTLNAHFGTPPGGGFDPSAGSELLAELQPDVVLLQEMDDNRTRSHGVDLTMRWSDELGMTGVYGPNLIDVSHVDAGRPAWFGNAVLTTGRVVEARNLALPWLDLPGCFTEPRGLLSVTVETPFGTRTVHGIHLDLNPAERMPQAWTVRSAVREGEAALGVLGGDLNTTPGRPDFRLLARTPGLYDAWAAAGEGEGFTHPAHEPRRRIDVLFPADRLRTTRVEVATGVASDHLAVRAELAAGTGDGSR